MAQFTITIPGVGDVTIDGPFATEDSITKLTAAIKASGSSKGTGKSKEQKDNDKLFDELNDSLEDADDSFDRLIRQTNNSGKAFGRLSSGLDRTIGGLKGLVSGSEGVSGGFGKMVDTIGGSASSFASLLPGIGSAVGGVITAFTGLAGTAIGYVQGLMSVNDQIMGIGAIFKGGIDEFQYAASEGSISMSYLTKSITTNTESFRMLTGGLLGGTKTITKAFKILGTDQQRVLYEMGYTTDEVMSGMADFAAMAKLSGQDLDMTQIAKGGADYLKVQRELTRLTGKSADELKRQREAMRSQAEFQAFFNNLADPNLRKAVENGMLAVPDATKEMVSKMLRGTPLTDPAMVQLLGMVPGVGKELAALGKQARDGTISESEYTRRFTAAINSLNMSSKNIVDSNTMFGLQADLYRDANPVLAKLIEMLQAGSEQAVPFNEALKSSQAAMNLFSGPEGVLSKAMGVFRDYDVKLEAVLNRFGASIAKVFTPKGRFVDMLDNLLKFSDDVSLAIDKWATGTGTFEDLWHNAYESFKTNFGEIFSTTTGILKDWLSAFSDAIAYGIQKGFDSIAAGFGWKTEGQVGREADDAIVSATDKLGKLPDVIEDVQRKTISAGRGGVTYAPMSETEKAQKDLYDKLYELTDEQLKEKGYEKTGNWLSGYQFKQIAPPNVPTYEPSIQGQFNNLDKNALGNMYEPKPGGHVVRVAEALDPEVIAPAKRGKDGKMGLEVTGVMLDNSQLLKALVDVNKNQASLIATLNSKVDGMTTAMEKLAYEQRHTNRLAG